MSLIDEALKRARMEAAQKAAESEGLPYPAIPRHLRPRRRRRWLAPLVLGLAILGGVLAGAMLASRGRPQPEAVATRAGGGSQASPSPAERPAAPAAELRAAAPAAAPSQSGPPGGAPAGEPTGAPPSEPQPPAEPVTPGPPAAHQEISRDPEPAAPAPQPTGRRDRGAVPPPDPPPARVQTSPPPAPKTPPPSPAPAPPPARAQTPSPARRAPEAEAPATPPAPGRSAPPPAAEAAPAPPPSATETVADPDSGVLLVLPDRAGQPAGTAAGEAPAELADESYVQRLPLPDGGAIELGGIAWSESGPFALIDGRVVGPGAVIGAYTLERIRPGHVVLAGEGRRVRLSLQ